MRAAEHALENARELDHLPSICLALSEAVCVAALTTGSEVALENAVTELRDATRRHGVSTWKARGRMWHALLQMRAGDRHVYERVIQPALDEIGGARFFVALTPFLSAVSQSLGAHGRMGNAMALLDPAIERARESGDECSLVELMRAKGELLLALDAPDGASEAARLIADGLSLAHRRRFLAWELRCATSLAALWHRQGRSQEAKHMLQGVYDRFSEGWGTADLVAARNLIATIG
jgi:predicted ATPase